MRSRGSRPRPGRGRRAFVSGGARPSPRRPRRPDARAKLAAWAAILAERRALREVANRRAAVSARPHAGHPGRLDSPMAALTPCRRELQPHHAPFRKEHQMHFRSTSIAKRAIPLAVAILATVVVVADDDQDHHSGGGDPQKIQLGPRPFYLVDGMDEGRLKTRLSQCKDGPFHRTDFSIGHRGAALQFPEHSMEAYNAGARMGA